MVVPSTSKANHRSNGAVPMEDPSITVGPNLHASRTPLDKKLYRHITLANGLQALLIQDTVAMQQQQQSTYDMEEEYDEDDDEEEDDEEEEDGLLRDAACSIVVGAGSVSDPPHCAGCAHFLEHLLFMGSEKYPDENEYSSYVSKYGGHDNAFTEWEYTIYNVELPNPALWGAVDRLAQFFVAPLFRPAAVARELQSIESEFRLHQSSDATRRQQFLCSTSDATHPMANFSWGNLQSLQTIPDLLGLDPLQEIRNFYQQHYFAQNMRLVIQGAYTLDELQAGIVQYFHNVPALPRDGSSLSLQRTRMEQAGFPFPPRVLGTIARIIPVKERHSLTITWQIPPQLSHWKSKPTDYISHLMGHEASGSILSYLRKQSWASGCMAGCGGEGSENATSHALFSMTLMLSEAGVHAWKDVVRCVYQYIGLLRQQCRTGWPEWIYEELRQIHELSYRYRDEASPEETVEQLAEQMAPHIPMPVERVLDGSSLLFEFDEVLIQTQLDDYLQPDKGRIDIMSSLFGRPSDFQDISESSAQPTSTIVTNLEIQESTEDDVFDVVAAGVPQVDPMFKTQFWCHRLSQQFLDELAEAAQPGRPTNDMLHLPPLNPFVPQDLQLKPLPHDDCDHPLLNASLKLCVAVGKTKQWFPATVVQYSLKRNSLKLSFEDEDEKWHVLDHEISEFSEEILCRSDAFEGTMDSRKIKFRIVALSLHPGAKGAGVRKFGDETDLDVEDGTSFPPIPPPSSRLPIQISNTNSLKMWWLQDRKFKRPIAEFRLQVICRDSKKSPLHRASMDLLRKVCADALLETTYLADVCELSCSIDATDIGFYLRFHGFNDKLLDLFETTMHLLLSFRNSPDELPKSIEADQFSRCLEILERDYKNSGMSSSSFTNSLRLRAICPTMYSPSQKLKALDGLNISTFCKTICSVFESFSVEALIHGNVAKTDADKARDSLLNLLDLSGGALLSRKQYPPQSVLRIPLVAAPSQIVVPSLNPNEPNTTCEVYIQVGKDNLRDRVMMDLLMHMMDNPMYDQIRTQDQFGYDVHCDVRWTYGIIGCIFHVTTNVKSSMEVVERIDQFLKDYREDLVKMSHTDFQEHLVGLAKQKLDMFNALSEETDCLWSEIYDGRFEWEAWRNETICLKGISKEDVLAFLDEWMFPGKKRNILAVQVIGTGETDASKGRPVVESNHEVDYADGQVQAFHKLCKNQSWGRVNSKLF